MVPAPYLLTESANVEFRQQPIVSRRSNYVRFKLSLPKFRSSYLKNRNMLCQSRALSKTKVLVNNQL